MSEVQNPPIAQPIAASEDRVMAAIIYALFIIGPSNGLTVLIGLILAYVSVGAAGPKMRTHYIFQIRTFWTCVVWAFFGGMVTALGAVLLLVLIGFPIMHLGVGIVGLSGLWFVVRSVAGAVYLAQDQAYPRPRSWLI